MLQKIVATNIGQNSQTIRGPKILGAGLYTTSCVERVLAFIRSNATFLPWGLIRNKIYTSFLNDAEILTTYFCVLWCSQIIYIRPYTLNTTTSFDLVTECWDVSVFAWGRVQAKMLPYFTGLDQVWTQCLTLDVVLYQLLRASEQQCHECVCNPVVLPPNSLLIVLLCLFLPICIVQTVCVCSLCTYHVFLKKNVRYPVWT